MIFNVDNSASVVAEDYIVETSTQGIWTIEKWNSGKAVAYGKHEMGTYSWVAWGSYAIESNNSDFVEFPTGIFIDNPLLFVNLIDERGVLATFTEIWKYDGTKCQIRAVRPKTSSNPSTPAFISHIELKGRWK